MTWFGPREQPLMGQFELLSRSGTINGCPLSIVTSEPMGRGISTNGKEQRLVRIRVADNMPGWRNGRRCGLKIRCPKGRAGSTPALGTTINPLCYNNLHLFPELMLACSVCAK